MGGKEKSLSSCFFGFFVSFFLGFFLCQLHRTAEFLSIPVRTRMFSERSKEMRGDRSICKVGWKRSRRAEAFLVFGSLSRRKD